MTQIIVTNILKKTAITIERDTAVDCLTAAIEWLGGGFVFLKDAEKSE